MASTRQEKPQPREDMSEEKDQAKVPDPERDDLAKRKTQASPSQLDFPIFVSSSITQADKETWDRLKVSGKTRYYCYFLNYHHHHHHQ